MGARRRINKMFIALVVFAVVLILSWFKGEVRADSVTLPRVTDDWNGFPFNYNSIGYYAYQQVYPTTLLPDYPILITDNTFYDTVYGSSTIIPGNYSLYFSTTSKIFLSVSGSPQDNLSSENKLFFSGNLGGPVSDTSFTIAGTPYLYDPSNGNLIWTIYTPSIIVEWNSQGGFDSASYTTDATRAVFGTIMSFSDRPGNAVVTTFTYNPVPEPTTMLLLGSGLIGLAGYGRKKFFKK